MTVLVFLATGVTAVAMIGLARWIAVTDPRRRPGWLPKRLVHSWSVGLFGLAGGYVFSSLPFLLIGEDRAAGAGALAATVVIGFVGRDVLARIRDDLGRHRRERRGLFSHHQDCAEHP